LNCKIYLINVLIEELAPKLDFVSSPTKVIDNDQWTVLVELIDLHRINAHLEQFYVRDHSTQMNELISTRNEPNRGFSCVINASHIELADDVEHLTNRYISEVGYASCAIWNCDAKTSVQKKARDIRTKLSQAVKQLPKGINGAVHIGLETMDGWLVEQKRYQRIFETVQQFDAKDISLERVYVHLFQPYWPPDRLWVYDETVYYFNNSNDEVEQPLSFPQMIVPPEDFASGVHWDKEPP